MSKQFFLQINKISKAGLIFCLVLSLGIFSFELALAGGGGSSSGSSSGGNTNVDPGNTPGSLDNDGRTAGGWASDNWGNEYSGSTSTVSEGEAGGSGNGGNGGGVSSGVANCIGTTDEVCYGWSGWSPCSTTSCGVTGTMSHSQSCQCIYWSEWGSSAGPLYTVTETINCTGPNCNGSGYCGPQTLACSAGNVLNIYRDYYDDSCVNGSCLFAVTIPNYCGSTQNCGTERCTDSSVWRERCKDGDVYEFQWGKDDSCSATTGCDTNIYHECPGTERIKDTCESETICKMTSSIDAECVAKSSEWTED